MIIICGYGTIGKSAAKELLEMREEFVVIDPNITSVPEGVRGIVEDAGREDVLLKAGVENASTIIVTTDSDATNALIVLMAKTVNSDIKALAIVKKVASIEKLYKAGADYVASDAMLGGRRIAKNAISPYVGDFIDRITLSKNVEITEMIVPSSSSIVNRPLKDSGVRARTGVNVIGVKRGEELLLTPSSNTIIKPRDKLVVIGSSEGIKKLSQFLKGE